MNIKKELATFFTWLRNGICFAFTWFMFLHLIMGWFSELFLNSTPSQSLEKLTLIFLGTTGAVLIFCLVFTRLVIRKLGFTARLTIFMILITVYEIICLNLMGIFTHIDFYQILLLLTFVVPMYLICLGIYAIYRRKKGKLYTEALKKYQQERRVVNE